MVSGFEEEGFTWYRGAVDALGLAALEVPFAGMLDGRPGGRVFDFPGEDPAVRAVATPLLAVAQRLGGQGVRPVRVLAFDKTPEHNWGLTWHQDRSIAVKERIEAPGFRHWNVKRGVLHVEPPLAILETMFSLRLHLDDCGEDNGPLRVLPGSHRLGRVRKDEVAERAERAKAVPCLAAAGDVLAVKALVIHASPPATAPHRRRVLHVDYAEEMLPTGLQWALD